MRLRGHIGLFVCHCRRVSVQFRLEGHTWFFRWYVCVGGRFNETLIWFFVSVSIESRTILVQELDLVLEVILFGLLAPPFSLADHRLGHMQAREVTYFMYLASFQVKSLHRSLYVSCWSQVQR